MYRIKIDPNVLQRFPEYSLMVIYAKGLQNSESQPWSTDILRRIEAQQRIELQKPIEHPHIIAWRTAYAKFGLKPSKFPCSAEALLTRVAKGHELPSINTLVDLYNATSINYVIPIGGEDWDQLEHDLMLRFADGTEVFDTIKDGLVVLEHPNIGEVIWANANQVTCRAWNWRQGLRTRLSTSSVNAYFILDRLQPLPLEQLQAATNELISYLKLVSPSCEIETEFFGADS
jgi:DNA/RNA-binding domain of Phe-tRNA-synthetase-like protein